MTNAIFKSRENFEGARETEINLYKGSLALRIH